MYLLDELKEIGVAVGELIEMELEP